MEWKSKYNKIITSTLFIALTATLLLMGVRGYAGNPTITELNSEEWMAGGPFELSPERGRYALMYSLVENHSVKFSLDVARFALPDLGLAPDGGYVSLFAPGVSYLIAPGYMLGKILGAGQVGAFAVVSFFALLNAILIWRIAVLFGADSKAGMVGAMAFLFATPAFAYAGTLYQHHISVFMVLVSLYVLRKWDKWYSLLIVWFMCAASIAIDNPNFFLMLPIGIFALFRIIKIKYDDVKLSLSIKPWLILTMLVMAIPVFMFLSYNKASHDEPLKLSGTLRAISDIEADGTTFHLKSSERPETADSVRSYRPKSAIGFFKTRNLWNGFYIHILSPDRGVINFAPIVLFGIWGFVVLYKKEKAWINLMLAIIGMDILLYSMWGDPYGGWAFGSRYLIPAYAVLGIAIAVGLGKIRKQPLIMILFTAVFAYSAWVASVGALTSIANPPKVEVLALEEISGHEEKYTYQRNVDYLNDVGVKSFVHNSWLPNVPARIYHKSVYFLILVPVLLLLLAIYKPSVYRFFKI